jgi:hypothetical protein
MTHPLIAKITDPEAGQIELLMEADILIRQRDTWKRVAEIMLPCLREAPSDLEEHLNYLYKQASLLLEKEWIDSGKVC